MLLNLNLKNNLSKLLMESGQIKTKNKNWNAENKSLVYYLLFGIETFFILIGFYLTL